MVGLVDIEQMDLGSLFKLLDTTSLSPKALKEKPYICLPVTMKWAKIHC